LVATSAFAEPSFNQVQDLIGRQQYAAAEQGLVEIIKNHPQSAKAYYSMAQAQAGLGNLDKARYALDKATGLDPTLSFASQSQVQSLREALTPQVKKIEMVEESHWFRNTVLALIFFGGLTWLAMWYMRRNEDEEGDGYASKPTPKSPAPDDYKSASPSDRAYMREHNLHKTETGIKKGELNVMTAGTGVGKSVFASASVPPRGRETTVKYAAPTPAPTPAPVVQPVTHTTVVNQSNDGFLTGMLVGNMLSDHHHHDRVVEREVIREVPSKSVESSSSRSSSWDSDSSSSSWDSDSSSSSRSSSSWSSSSSSDSSWDSGSSSSSSWDSGSSSSDSSW
jgi:hypothetical protein